MNPKWLMHENWWVYNLECENIYIYIFLFSRLSNGNVAISPTMSVGNQPVLVSVILSLIEVMGFMSHDGSCRHSVKPHMFFGTLNLQELSGSC